MNLQECIEILNIMQGGIVRDQWGQALQIAIDLATRYQQTSEELPEKTYMHQLEESNWCERAAEDCRNEAIEDCRIAMMKREEEK